MYPFPFESKKKQLIFSCTAELGTTRYKAGFTHKVPVQQKGLLVDIQQLVVLVFKSLNIVVFKSLMLKFVK